MTSLIRIGDRDFTLDPATTDVKPPTTGTAEAKEKAVAEKLAAVVPVAEYEKLAALAATVVLEEKLVKDKQPVDIDPVEKLVVGS